MAKQPTFKPTPVLPPGVQPTFKNPGPVKPPAPPSFESQLKGAQRDAYLALNTLFTSFGLGSLSSKIFDYVKNGYSADTISILLQDTPEYKKRFIGNEARRKAGLNVLSPAEYIATENSYRQIMSQGGMPKGFYDSNEDFAKFIGNDMSPTELKERVDIATQASILGPPEFRSALKQMGLSDGDMAAYWLDPKKALPYLAKFAATAQIGAEALERGFSFDQRYAENLAQQGITAEQAASGYAQIGDEFQQLQTLGSIYGRAWTQRTAEEEQFRGGIGSGNLRRGLIAQEEGAFSGSAGTARAGLAQRGGMR